MIDYSVAQNKFGAKTGLRMCSLSVMDDSIEGISFDSEGVCNFVRGAQWRLNNERFVGSERDARLKSLLSRIQRLGKKRDYDCLIGLSGGVDSSYVAMKVVEMGLRPLAVHLDNGWNSELAVGNIEKIIRKLGIDLLTYVIDWEEFKDVQRSYFLASVMDLECVSDHAINTILLREANKRGIRFLLHGGNVASESILPASWGYDKRDGYSLRSIHRKFGTLRLKSYPYMMPWKLFYYLFVRRIAAVPILNYVDYNKTEAVQELIERFDWRPYPRKHGENRFTRFFQEYYLPVKFGIDKRIAHFSSLIVAGEMTKDEAIARLATPLYTPQELDEEFEYVANKLGFTPDQFSEVIAQPPKKHTDYPNVAWMFDHSSKWVQLARYLAKGEFSVSRIKAVWRETATNFPD